MKICMICCYIIVIIVVVFAHPSRSSNVVKCRLYAKFKWLVKQIQKLKEKDGEGRRLLGAVVRSELGARCLPTIHYRLVDRRLNRHWEHKVFVSLSNDRYPHSSIESFSTLFSASPSNCCFVSIQEEHTHRVMA